MSDFWQECLGGFVILILIFSIAHSIQIYKVRQDALTQCSATFASQLGYLDCESEITYTLAAEMYIDTLKEEWK